MAKRRSKSNTQSSAEPLDRGLKPPVYPLRPVLPIWKCPNCGQNYFGTHPPDTCDYCQDFTTWRPIKPDDEPNDPDP